MTKKKQPKASKVRVKYEIRSPEFAKQAMKGMADGASDIVAGTFKLVVAIGKFIGFLVAFAIDGLKQGYEELEQRAEQRKKERAKQNGT